jgi:murein DD-endopeptidase MepM/ murein hydrolase activator NlpD
MIYIVLPIVFLFSCTSIKIQGEKPLASDLAGTYYRAKKGDDLSQVAKKHHVRLSELLDVNGIEDQKVRAGQMIYIPEPDPISKKLASIAKPQIADIKNTSKFIRPVAGEIIRKFSQEKANPYDGIAIKAPLGTKVKAALEGRVIYSGNDGNKFGLLVIIEHKAPFITVYTQLDKTHVTVGQYLKKGETLGTVGKSGGVSTPHLHFQIRKNQQPEDPKDYLKL